MAVGAVSGLAAGLLMLDFRDDGLDYRSGPAISLVTDKREYVRGEPVTVRVVNTGTVPLEGSWSFVVTGLSGMRMYGAEHDPDHTLEPGSHMEIEWGQTRTDGKVVLEGLYRIAVEGLGPHEVRDSATVMIWK